MFTLFCCAPEKKTFFFSLFHSPPPPHLLFDFTGCSRVPRSWIHSRSTTLGRRSRASTNKIDIRLFLIFVVFSLQARWNLIGMRKSWEKTWNFEFLYFYFLSSNVARASNSHKTALIVVVFSSNLISFSRAFRRSRWASFRSLTQWRRSSGQK